MPSNEQPGCGTERYTRGVELYRQGKHEQAVAALKPLLSRGDLVSQMAKFYSGMAHRATGMEALQQGQFDRAERHLKLAVEAIGRDADLAAYLASIHARKGHQELCLREMEHALDREQRERTWPWRRLAQAQWRTGRRAEAHMTLNHALRRLGEKAELHLQLGLFHAAEEHFAEAKACFARAAEADCTSPEAHYYLGLAAAAQGDVAQAARSLQRAFLLRPNDLVLAYQLALAARAADQSGVRVALPAPEPILANGGSEVRQLADYVAAEPDFVDAFLALPETDADGPLFNLLVGVLRAALAAHAGRADLHLHLSRALQRVGQTEPAVHHARKATEVNPRYVQAFVQLARLHAGADRVAEALEAAQQAIACGGDWPDVHLLVAELMKRCDAMDGAAEHLRRALQLNPNYAPAAEALTSLAA